MILGPRQTHLPLSVPSHTVVFKKQNSLRLTLSLKLLPEVPFTPSNLLIPGTHSEHSILNSPSSNVSSIFGDGGWKPTMLT